jgi:molybdate transport system substrate-binding protein
LRILSAGAAQAVTERIIEAFSRDTGARVAADFGAVGAMKAKVTAGEPVDVVTLTQPLIEELIGAGYVEPGSRFDLGKVGTGVAVRAGANVPDTSAAALRERIGSASVIVFPDPATATAGKVVMALMEKLGVLDEARGRFRFFPNGYAAMAWLAQSGDERALGITQVTEIIPNSGVAYAGPLPDEFQMKAVYSTSVAARAPERALARDFVARFRTESARMLLKEAGYET